MSSLRPTKITVTQAGRTTVIVIETELLVPEHVQMTGTQTHSAYDLASSQSGWIIMSFRSGK